MTLDTLLEIINLFKRITICIRSQDNLVGISIQLDIRNRSDIYQLYDYIKPEIGDKKVKDVHMWRNDYNEEELIIEIE